MVQAALNIGMHRNRGGDIVKVFNLEVDFYNAVRYIPARFVKGDNNCYKINLTIVQDITDKIVVISFQLPDNSPSIKISANIIDAHTAELILPTDVLSKEGEVYCQVALYTETSRITNPVQFYYRVAKDLAADAITDIDDRVPILTELINDVLSLRDWVESIEFKVIDSDLIMEVSEWLK